jgi:hypothetical protein
VSTLVLIFFGSITVSSDGTQGIAFFTPTSSPPKLLVASLEKQIQLFKRDKFGTLHQNHD